MNTRAWKNLSFDHACALIVLALIALRPLLTPLAPHDFWWHLRQGERIAQSGAIPTHDAFSWTQNGRAFFDQSWLAQIFLHVLHRIGGLELIVLAQAIVVTVSYALLLQMSARRARQSRAPLWGRSGTHDGERQSSQSGLRLCALVLAGVMLVSFDNWLVRPQTYALPIFVAFFAVLTGFRFGWRRALWPLPLLMILWVNTHGSFPLGLALLVLALGGESIKSRRAVDANSIVADSIVADSILDGARWRQLALWSALTATATLVNPRGLGVWSYVRLMLSSPSNSFSSEWLSPSPRHFNDALFFIFVLVFFVVLIFAARRPDLTDLITGLAFLWLAWTSGRYIIWFAIVAMPMLCVALSNRQTAKNDAPSNALVNWILVASVWSLLIPALPAWKARFLPPPLGSLLSGETPVRAVKVLCALSANRRPRRLWHNAATGSYLIHAAPAQRVFIDTRFELYPTQQWKDFLMLQSGHEVERLTRKYRFDGWLLDLPQERALFNALSRDKRWKLAHRDSRAALFISAALVKNGGQR